MEKHDEGIPVDTSGPVDTLPEEATTGESTALEDEKQIEQEVLLVENDEPREEEASNWDGSESEFVEDDDAEAYEEQYAGIKFGYALKKEEIFSCLKHSGFFKATSTRSVVEACLFTILAVMFFILFFVTKGKINLILGVISVGLVVASVLMPRLFVGVNASKLTTGKKLFVEIYPDEISVDGGSATWKIPLDGTCIFEEFEEMFLIYLPQGRLFIIPTRAIEPDLLADVQAMIVAGTKPKEEE